MAGAALEQGGGRNILEVGVGTDVAVATADVILVRSNPLDAVSIVKLSRATYRKMLQNLCLGDGIQRFCHTACSRSRL